MNLNFSKDELIKAIESSEKNKDLQIVSKASDVDEKDFSNIVQIIDESGNEMNCTYNKFIEIFDNKGLEGFIL